jgi:hypothetical protein
MAGRRGANVLFLVCICWLFSLCSAARGFYISEQMIDSSADVSPLDSGSGRLLVDLRPPPNPKAWTLATKEDALQRRGLGTEDNNNDESTSDESSSTSSSSAQETSMASSYTTTATPAHHTHTSSSSTTTISSSSTSASSSAQSSQPSSSPLPTPFDQGFAGNITEGCSNFVYKFIAEQTFISCLPFSLLLQVCFLRLFQKGKKF